MGGLSLGGCPGESSGRRGRCRAARRRLGTLRRSVTVPAVNAGSNTPSLETAGGPGRLRARTRSPSLPPPRATSSPTSRSAGSGACGRSSGSHGRGFAIAIAAGMVALVAQIAVPCVLRGGIDDALDERDQRSSRRTSWILVGLAVARVRVRRPSTATACSAPPTTSRPTCARIIYDTSPGCRSRFYDRIAVGPGHLARQQRHPLGADAPRVRSAHLMSALTFVLAFVFMLSINVGLTLVALSHDAGRLPRRRTGCATRCSRCRGSSRPAWPTSRRSSTRTSTACAW